VYGVAITDLKSLIQGGNNLTEIVNGLATLYDEVENLDDFKHQVDNFARAKNETIIKAMTRAMNLIEKLSPLNAKVSWLDRKEDILKQIVDKNQNFHQHGRDENDLGRRQPHPKTNSQTRV
jgi:hypothetical protein